MDKQRVIVYIDGFNFYYGLKKDARWKKYYWLDIVKLYNPKNEKELFRKTKSDFYINEKCLNFSTVCIPRGNKNGFQLAFKHRLKAIYLCSCYSACWRIQHNVSVSRAVIHVSIESYSDTILKWIAEVFIPSHPLAQLNDG